MHISCTFLNKWALGGTVNIQGTMSFVFKLGQEESGSSVRGRLQTCVAQYNGPRLIRISTLFPSCVGFWIIYAGLHCIAHFWIFFPRNVRGFETSLTRKRHKNVWKINSRWWKHSQALRICYCLQEALSATNVAALDSAKWTQGWVVPFVSMRPKCCLKRTFANRRAHADQNHTNIQPESSEHQQNKAIKQLFALMMPFERLFLPGKFLKRCSLVSFS